MLGGLRDGDRLATPHQYLTQAVKLMVEFDPGPILDRGQRRAQGLGAEGEQDFHLARGEVEQIGGVVGERRRQIAGSHQSELDLMQYDALNILALILEQDDHVSRPPNAARRRTETLIAIRLDGRPAILEVLVIARGVEHQRGKDIHRGCVGQAQLEDVRDVFPEADLPEVEPLLERGEDMGHMVAVELGQEISMEVIHPLGEAGLGVFGQVDGPCPGVIVPGPIGTQDGTFAVDHALVTASSARAVI